MRVRVDAIQIFARLTFVKLKNITVSSRMCKTHYGWRSHLPKGDTFCKLVNMKRKRQEKGTNGD